MKKILSIICILISGLVISQTNYYVDEDDVGSLNLGTETEPYTDLMDTFGTQIGGWEGVTLWIKAGNVIQDVSIKFWACDGVTIRKWGSGDNPVLQQLVYANSRNYILDIQSTNDFNMIDIDMRGNPSNIGRFIGLKFAGYKGVGDMTIHGGEWTLLYAATWCSSEQPSDDYWHYGIKTFEDMVIFNIAEDGMFFKGVMSDITIDNCHIYNVNLDDHLGVSEQGGDGMQFTGTFHNLVVKNCIIDRRYTTRKYCIIINEGTEWSCCYNSLNIHIHNNVFYPPKDSTGHISSAGAIGFYGVGEILFEYNYINGRDRIYSGSGDYFAMGEVLATDAVFNYNIWDSVSKLVVRTYSHNTTFNNNIFTANTSTNDAIITAHGTDRTLFNNCIGLAGTGDILYKESPYSGTELPGENNYTAEAEISTWEGLVKWVDYDMADFHLLSTSPVIDAGVLVSGLTFDFDSVPVPQGLAPDIGAYEYEDEAIQPITSDSSYIDPDWTGTESGTIAEPYSSYTSVAADLLNTDGTIIFQKRGTTFSGTSTIIIGADSVAFKTYDSGADPIITIADNNAVEVTNSSVSSIEGFDIRTTGTVDYAVLNLNNANRFSSISNSITSNGSENAINIFDSDTVIISSTTMIANDTVLYANTVGFLNILNSNLLSQLGAVILFADRIDVNNNNFLNEKSVLEINNTDTAYVQNNIFTVSGASTPDYFFIRATDSLYFGYNKTTAPIGGINQGGTIQGMKTGRIMYNSFFNVGGFEMSSILNPIVVYNNDFVFEGYDYENTVVLDYLFITGVYGDIRNNLITSGAVFTDTISGGTPAEYSNNIVYTELTSFDSIFVNYTNNFELADCFSGINSGATYSGYIKDLAPKIIPINTRDIGAYEYAGSYPPPCYVPPVLDTLPDLNNLFVGTYNDYFVDGSSFVTTVPDDNSLDFGEDDFTIITSQYANELSTNKYIIKKDDYTGVSPAGEDLWQLYINSSNLVTFYSNTDDIQSIAVDVDTWYNIVIRRHGDTCRLNILNTAYEITDNTFFSGKSLSNDQDLLIGGTGNKGIDNIIIFKDYLTDAEIAGLNTFPSIQSDPRIINGFAENCVLWMPFGEQPDNVNGIIYDWSSYENHGTMSTWSTATNEVIKHEETNVHITGSNYLKFGTYDATYSYWNYSNYGIVEDFGKGDFNWNESWTITGWLKPEYLEQYSIVLRISDYTFDALNDDFVSFNINDNIVSPNLYVPYLNFQFDGTGSGIQGHNLWLTGEDYYVFFSIISDKTKDSTFFNIDNNWHGTDTTLTFESINKYLILESAGHGLGEIYLFDDALTPDEVKGIKGQNIWNKGNVVAVSDKVESYWSGNLLKTDSATDVYFGVNADVQDPGADQPYISFADDGSAEGIAQTNISYNGDFSLSFWLKYDTLNWKHTVDISNYEYHIMNKKSTTSFSNSSKGWGIYNKLSVGYMMFYAGDGTNSEYETYSYVDALAPYNNDWLHWTFTLAEDTLRYYINGVFKDYDIFTTALDLANTFNTYDLEIGRGVFSTYRGCFGGKLDEVRIWQRQLSDDEVLANYVDSVEVAGITFRCDFDRRNEDADTVWSYYNSYIGTVNDIDNNNFVEGSYMDLNYLRDAFSGNDMKLVYFEDADIELEQVSLIYADKTNKPTNSIFFSDETTETYIELPDSSELRTGSVTCVIRYKPNTSIAETTRGLFSNFNSTSDEGWSVYHNATLKEIVLLYGEGSVNSLTTTDDALPLDNSYHNIIVSFDIADSSATIYVDGIENITESGDNKITYDATQTKSYIGQVYYNLNTTPHDGSIDWVYLDSTAFSEADALKYSAQNRIEPPLFSPYNTEVDTWDINCNDVYPVIQSKSGNHDGTMSGTSISSDNLICTDEDTK